MRQQEAVNGGAEASGILKLSFITSIARKAHISSVEDLCAFFEITVECQNMKIQS